MNFKTLFNFIIHHGYFLDKGLEKYKKVHVYDNEMSQEDKNQALKEYNISEYLKITPSDFTKNQFQNYRMIMRPYASGFRILVNVLPRELEGQERYEPIIPLEEDMYLTFELQATDSYFYNYSNVFDLSDSRMYYFTNEVPAGQEVEFENIFDNNGGLIDSRFLLKATDTHNMIKAIALENENFFELKSRMLSLGKSIELIENNSELTEDQKETQVKSLLDYTIQKKKKRQIIGYIRLRVKVADVNKSLVEYKNDRQYLHKPTPEFTLSFVNIKSFWVFKSLADNATLTTKDEKWLSRNGYVEITSTDFDAGGLDPPEIDPEDYTFPNPTVDLITKDENNTYYSEIFI